MKPVSGFLNQKIDIVSFNDIDDGATGSKAVESVYWSTSAKVIFLKASRGLQATQEQLKPTVTFEIRFRDDKFLNVDMQVKWRGEYFTIADIIPDYVYKTTIQIMATSIKTPQR